MDKQLEIVPTPTTTSSLTTSNCILSVVMSGIFLFGGASNVFSLHFFLKQRPVNATVVTFRMITLVDLMTCIQASYTSTKYSFLNPLSKRFPPPPNVTKPRFLPFHLQISHSVICPLFWDFLTLNLRLASTLPAHYLEISCLTLRLRLSATLPTHYLETLSPLS